ncbi:MAG: hypothetical protein ACLPVY_00800 [Acidimicrobiia bacterium]
MRKGSSLFAALVLLVSFGVSVAAPAGAAGPLPPNCKTFTGTETYSPALPKIGLSTKVNTTVTLSAKLAGCSGVSGITSGVSSGTTKVASDNCTVTVANADKGSKSTGTVKWNNGKTTTSSDVLTLKSKVGVSPATFQLVATDTSGVGAGHTTTTTLSVTLNTGACVTASLSKATFHATKSTTK